MAQRDKISVFSVYIEHLCVLYPPSSLWSKQMAMHDNNFADNYLSGVIRASEGPLVLKDSTDGFLPWEIEPLPHAGRRGTEEPPTSIHLARNTEAFSCSLELYLCSNEEAGGVLVMGLRHTAVILFLFEGDHGILWSCTACMWSVSPELLNSPLLCPFKLTVSLSLVLLTPSSVSLLFSVIHSVALTPALVSPSPEPRCIVELFLSWIMCINCRGQMEWVLWDNDWSDGTWAPPDCGVSELVIKRQGGGTLDARCVL